MGIGLGFAFPLAVRSCSHRFVLRALRRKPSKALERKALRQLVRDVSDGGIVVRCNHDDAVGGDVALKRRDGELLLSAELDFERMVKIKDRRRILERRDSARAPDDRFCHDVAQHPAFAGAGRAVHARDRSEGEGRFVAIVAFVAFAALAAKGRRRLSKRKDHVHRSLLRHVEVVRRVARPAAGRKQRRIEKPGKRMRRLEQVDARHALRSAVEKEPGERWAEGRRFRSARLGKQSRGIIADLMPGRSRFRRRGLKERVAQRRPRGRSPRFGKRRADFREVREIKAREAHEIFGAKRMIRPVKNRSDGHVHLARITHEARNAKRNVLDEGFVDALGLFGGIAQIKLEILPVEAALNNAPVVRRARQEAALAGMACEFVLKLFAPLQCRFDCEDGRRAQGGNLFARLRNAVIEARQEPEPAMREVERTHKARNRKGFGNELAPGRKVKGSKKRIAAQARIFADLVIKSIGRRPCVAKRLAKIRRLEKPHHVAVEPGLRKDAEIDGKKRHRARHLCALRRPQRFAAENNVGRFERKGKRMRLMAGIRRRFRASVVLLILRRMP